MSEFSVGDQIAYIPLHAGSDVMHADVEYGFITMIDANAGVAACRYWRKDNPYVLRTTANSELTSLKRLVHFRSVSEPTLNAAIEAHGITELQFRVNGIIVRSED